MSASQRRRKLTVRGWVIKFAFGCISPGARYSRPMEKREKTLLDSELRRRIQELIAYKGGRHNEDLVEDIIENGLKLLRDVEDRGDVKVIQTALRELRYAFKLFAPYAGTRKVTIFGSARTLPSKTEYKQAGQVARQISVAGFMISPGAGPGMLL